jgi:hypothetical protein
MFGKAGLTDANIRDEAAARRGTAHIANPQGLE